MRYLTLILSLTISLFTQAEKYTFEKGIPTQFQTSENSHIELSPLYYKDGIKSLKWDYQPHSFLTLKTPLKLTSQTEKNY
uniref:chondroitinase family protein n=1 Tax=Phocaeicola sp. TaxID=2773926 RepID=UPI003A945F26